MTEARKPDRRQLIDSVSQWTIDGEEDDTQRYFYHFHDVSEIEAGKYYAVVAYKGQGKTAIAKWLDAVNAEKRSGLCVRLSLKDFEFPELYELADKNQAFQNQYSTIWTYVILCSICLLIQNDGSIDILEKDYYKRKFKKESRPGHFDLVDILRRGGGFTIQPFGFTLGAAGKFGFFDKLARYRKSIERFKIEIKNLRITKPYYIIFDELDEDYNNIVSDSAKRRQYLNIIVSLLKSIEQMRRFISADIGSIIPVMMLRRDIYDIVHFNDKGKLASRILDISWNSERIRDLLNYRLCRALDPDVQAEACPDFWTTWRNLFDDDDFKRNSIDPQRVFNYITQRTFLRPRDYIAYLKFAANSSMKRSSSTGITGQDLMDAEKEYSKYLRQEIDDACGGIHIDFMKVVDSVSDIQKRTFSVQELKDNIEQSALGDVVSAIGINQIVDLLYYFNVVGMHRQRYAGAFHYMRVGSKLRPHWELVVHRGLWRNFELAASDLRVLRVSRATSDD